VGATVGATGRRRWTMMAAIAIAAGVAGTAAGLWIGMAITKP
jgi:hypothetical protein